MSTKVTVRYIEHLQHQVICHPHSFIADEPEEDSGDGLGPNPYDLLLSSLGVCTAMTLAMYAVRKKIPLEAVTVELGHERTYREDCKDCSEEEKRMETISRAITVKGSLTEEQKGKLLEIAEKCPVHRTIQKKPVIKDSIRIID